MKKTMIAAALAVLALSPVFAQVGAAGQTIYNKYQFSVDSETEARSIDISQFGFHITFTRNACYDSDSNGIQMPYTTASAHQGEQNNMLVFIIKSKPKPHRRAA